MSIDLAYPGDTRIVDGGGLTLADINNMFETLYHSARVEPDVWYVSPQTVKRLRHLERVGKLHRAHPLPRHKIRKCHMRRIWTARQQGMARIARIERKEAQEEAEFLRHVRKNNWETDVFAKQGRAREKAMEPPDDSTCAECGGPCRWEYANRYGEENE